MYARMVIGEAISDAQLRDFAELYAREVLPELRQEPGFESGRFMVEEGGRMAVSLTLWRTREDCLRYHSSRSYRQCVTRTHHLLVGGFVVRLFREH
jgi:heme-degrading monooxygenase HmoA